MNARIESILGRLYESGKMICSPFAPNTTPLVPRRELRLDGLLNQEYGRLTLHSVSCQSSLVFVPLFLYSSLGNSQPHPSRIDDGSTTQRERTASHQKSREDNQPREVRLIDCARRLQYCAGTGRPDQSRDGQKYVYRTCSEEVRSDAPQNMDLVDT